MSTQVFIDKNGFILLKEYIPIFCIKISIFTYVGFVCINIDRENKKRVKKILEIFIHLMSCEIIQALLSDLNK